MVDDVFDLMMRLIWFNDAFDLMMRFILRYLFYLMMRLI